MATNIDDLEKVISGKLQELKGMQGKLEDLSKHANKILPKETKQTKDGKAFIMANGTIIIEFTSVTKAKKYFDSL